MNHHSDTATAIRGATGWDLDSYADARNWAGVATGPVGQHRDSEALDRSNFAVIFEALSDKFGDDVDNVSFGHWAVGWVEELAWNAGNSAIADEVESWKSALADYPVADDTHFSDLEWEDNHPREGECYSDDTECGCGNNE
jgi:hypothetical protein